MADYVHNGMIAVVGYARSGKDTFAEMLVEALQPHIAQTLRFTSSSLFACERAVMPTLAPKYGYKAPEDAFADRMQHRQEWADLITAYNAGDPARLGREMREAGMSIYVGCRRIAEMDAMYWQGITGPWIWVDRPGITAETGSMDFGVCKFAERAPIGSRIVLNNHGLEYLRTQARMTAEDLISSGWVP